MNHDTTVQTFADQVKALPGGEFLELCYACGTCVSKCMIQQKGELKYNPRRLLRLAMLDMKQEAFDNPTTWLCSACDLCYAACPQEIHISGVINAVKKIAVDEGRVTPIQTAEVNQQTCVGCGLCTEGCPYQAISLVEKKVPFRGMIQVAEVDPGLCMGCGLCSAICRSTSIGIPAENTDNEILDDLWSWMQPQEVRS
jgi:heterodisulfide reductase subunit C